ncbi:hypothetical protein ACQPW1_00525 [Nocardia sp. CA-128927]|uniref:hypothetical protein n=1 Tax=Nocardia sp. CA-128927 TaxID=3239975 RepID=UPI003D994C89
MRTVAVLTIAAASIALAGCSTDSTSETKDAPTSAAAAPASAAPAAAGCYKSSPISDPDLAAFAAGLQLPPGVHVVTGRVSTQSDKPGLVGVALDLCVPDSKTPDALRPIATQIAAALKPTDLGSRTFALYVADKDPAFKDEAKIKDGDYKLHLWNGQPSAAAELERWQVVTG